MNIFLNIFLFYYIMKIHLYSLQGERDYNEDRYIINENGGETFLGIFDGHGGDFVSNFLEKNILKYFENNFDNKQVRTVVQKMQQKLKKEKEARECGSTLLVCRLNNKNVQVVNVGDSRAIMKYDGKVYQLNTEHKPTNEEEKVRITLSGGELEYDEEDEIYRINGYALSRSLGDTNYDIISQKPEIRNFKKSSKIEYILLASDGLWDVMTNQDVENFLKNKITKKIPDKSLSKTKDNLAFQLSSHAHKLGSMDNITILLFMPNL